MQTSLDFNFKQSLNVDLHCHTTASDGDLSPTEIVERAIKNGVDVLAITDHDNIDGYLEAKKTAVSDRIKLITGIEFSAVWGGVNIHIVGLDFDPQCLQLPIERQKTAREARALEIAKRLERQGVKNALAGAQHFATNSRVMGRPQFAKYLVAKGYFKTEKDAFNKWLGDGKIGDVKTNWPDIQTVVKDVTNAGGHAVLAHPHHYKLTNHKLGKLLTDFKQCGGAAMEVCASGITPDKTKYFAMLCEKYDLMASRGSDFHTPANVYTELGRVAALPNSVTPIWQMFK